MYFHPFEYKTRVKIYKTENKNIENYLNYDREVKNSLQLKLNFYDPNMNTSLSPCKDPYEYFCNVKEKNIQELMEIGNKKILHSSIYSNFYQTSLFQHCVQFHKLKLHEKYSILNRSNIFQNGIKLINDAFSKESPNHFGLASNLHKMGIREPFHVNYQLNSKYYFSQAQKLIQENGMMEDFLEYLGYEHKKLYNDYISITSKIHYYESETSTQFEYKLLNIKDIHKLGFINILDFAPYLNESSSIYIDMQLIYNYYDSIPMFNSESWKNYYLFAYFKSLMHQFRIHSNQNQLCMNFITEFFPISTCISFKKSVNLNTYDIDNYSTEIKNDFEKIILENNIFNLRNDTIKYVKNEIKNLIYIFNKCKTRIHGEDMYSFEKEFINSNYENYLDFMFKIIRDYRFQTRRNLNFDHFSRKMINDYISWGGSYYPDPKMLIIPPSVLLFSLNYLDYKSCQFHAISDHVIYHEFCHFFSHIMKNIKRENYYENFRKKIKILYNTHDETIDEENFADTLGYYITYNRFTSKNNSTKDKKCMFSTYTRLWCDVNYIDEEHSDNKKRAVYPLSILSYEYKKVFNCPLY